MQHRFYFILWTWTFLVRKDFVVEDNFAYDAEGLVTQALHYHSLYVLIASGEDLKCMCKNNDYLCVF